MKRMTCSLFVIFMMFTCFSSMSVLADSDVGVIYQGHVQNIGWQAWVNDGQLAGTEGQSLRMEALKVNLTNAPAGASIKYEAHVQNIGWQSWMNGNQEAGTTGQGLRMEAIKITLENLPGYSVIYRCHVQNIGWMPWVTDGEIAGTTGQSLRIEAIEIRLVKEDSLKIGDYFPIKENIRAVYEGQGNEFASYTVTNDYTTETKVQQRINNGGTESVAVVEIKDGKLIKILSKPETYYRENMLDKGDQEEILLMEPFQTGMSWTLTDSRVRTITNTAADVTTPYGNYQAIEVTTVDPNKALEKQLDYYVKDLGLVKAVFTVGDNPEDDITSSLKEIQEDTVLEQSISFFYPKNVDNEFKIYYQVREIAFKTNDITRKVLETAYKEDTGAGTAPVFSPNTKINSLYLNQDGMVYIDLSQDYLTEMNAGAELEGDMLQCIANTFGKYYGVQRVLLTIDNKLYESGHIALLPGEYLEVNLDGTVPIV